MNAEKIKILIIGIDGATWDVIDPMIEEDQLPNFARIKKTGSWAKLKSLDPPLTPIIWTSIASGKLKEKHGIFDFFGTSDDVRVKRIWDILEEKGYTIGLHEYPVTWPPREGNGFIIPDNFARDSSSYPSHLSFIKELAIGEKNEQLSSVRDRISMLIKMRQHGCQWKTFWKVFRYFVSKKMPHFSFLDDYYKSRMVKLYLYSDLFLELYKKYSPDFAVTYFNQVDALGHRFWKYMEPEGFDVPQRELRKYKDVIKKTYVAIDHQISRLLRVIPENSIVVILSDHGFKKTFTSPYGKSLQIKVEAFRKALEIPENIVGINVHKFTYFHSRKSSPSEREKDRKKLLGKLKKAQFTENGQKIYDLIEKDEWIIVKPVTSIDIPPETPLCRLKETSYKYGDFIKDTFVEFSGDHDDFGILLMAGTGLKTDSEIKNVSVLDIIPTLLAILGMPVGKDMDGKVLEEMIEEDHLKQNPIQYINSYEKEEDAKQIQSERPTSDEDEKIKKRLKDLGYL